VPSGAIAAMRKTTWSACATTLLKTNSAVATKAAGEDEPP
jgi:hypothetical protein